MFIELFIIKWHEEKSGNFWHAPNVGKMFHPCYILFKNVSIENLQPQTNDKIVVSIICTDNVGNM